jgi:hypothetical protein
MNTCNNLFFTGAAVFATGFTYVKSIDAANAYAKYQECVSRALSDESISCDQLMADHHSHKIAMYLGTGLLVFLVSVLATSMLCSDSKKTKTY